MADRPPSRSEEIASMSSESARIIAPLQQAEPPVLSVDVHVTNPVDLPPGPSTSPPGSSVTLGVDVVPGLPNSDQHRSGRSLTAQVEGKLEVIITPVCCQFSFPFYVCEGSLFSTFSQV